MSPSARSKAKSARRRNRGAVRVFGESLDSVYHVHLKPDQAISSFLQKVEGVAHERYTDGSLFFSGAPTEEQCEELGITQKPKWRPEVRCSRLLNLSIQAARAGAKAPQLTTGDAVRILEQSCLWADRECIELAQVVNRAKSTHIYVQFGDEALAKQSLNSVDAQPHTIKGQPVYVHSLQLNVEYQYTPAAKDPMVWHNPMFSGPCSQLPVPCLPPACAMTVTPVEVLGPVGSGRPVPAVSTQAAVEAKKAEAAGVSVLLAGDTTSSAPQSAWYCSEDTGNLSCCSLADLADLAELGTPHTEENSDTESQVEMDIDKAISDVPHNAWSDKICHVEYDDAMLSAFYV